MNQYFNWFANDERREWTNPWERLITDLILVYRADIFLLHNLENLMADLKNNA